MNRVELIGRIGNEPTVKEYGETKVLNLSVAISAANGKTDWVRCTAFNKRAETIAQYFKKGARIGIYGALKTDEYTDKQGNKRSSTYVIVDGFDFLESKPNGASKLKDFDPPLPQEDFAQIDEDVPF